MLRSYFVLGKEAVFQRRLGVLLGLKDGSAPRESRKRLALHGSTAGDEAEKIESIGGISLGKIAADMRKQTSR